MIIQPKKAEFPRMVSKLGKRRYIIILEELVIPESKENYFENKIGRGCTTLKLKEKIETQKVTYNNSK